ncbi:phosphoadenosine phosphosulfate reductase [Acinetobacter phage phiAC-1]|uniref:phosphoadenosine phosphosulfate reductase n=1 Tax=Acinetobacter phage phiAC-1 TaxID=1229760 RepID=UPI00028B375B|nr:phosphoadenosine phosphosulfate reductase [Acinetobacter phage phiAC-1]AFU62251.1 putative phosphoadenosine phosphosulfate reductase [Acinetobacter phage phiAC-1]
MIKCIVPISGGKDSQACLKLALKKFKKEEILGMFSDTGFEHPLTIQHIDNIRKMYGVQIAYLKDGDVYEKIYKYGRFPSDQARFCTDELKIQIGKQFYSMLARLQDGGFEVWYGMRSGESSQRLKRYKHIENNETYAPQEALGIKYPKYLEKLGISVRLPIKNWDEDEVFEFLNGEENPLYAAGFDRVGCFPCLAGGDKWKEKAFAFDDVGKQRRIEVLEIGRNIGKNIFTTKGGRFRNPDATFQPEEKTHADLFDDLAPCFHCNI